MHYERKVNKKHTHMLFLFLSGSKSETAVELCLIKYSCNVGTQKKDKRIEAQQKFREVF